MKSVCGAKHIFSLLMLTVVGSACSSTYRLSEENFSSSNRDPAPIVNRMPDYRDSLYTLRGKGRAIVSEPNNTERATVHFTSNRQKSLITVKNGLGIKGGQMLTDSDSLFIFNKVDNIARKLSVKNDTLSNINNLASLNILHMIDFTITGATVRNVLENDQTFLLQMDSGTKVYVDKSNYRVQKVVQPSTSRLPYSKIIYEAYGTVKDYKLPRKITIFSADKKSKISFLIQSVEINPELQPLTINFPEDVKVYHQ